MQGTEGDESVNTFYRFLCAAVAGCVGTAGSHPLDTMRVRYLVSKEATPLKGILATSSKKPLMVCHFKGLKPSLYGSSVYTGVTLTVFGELVDKCEPDRTEKACLGAFSGIVGQISSYPLNVIRRRQQAGLSPSDNILLAAKQIMRKEGLSAFYSGLKGSLLKTPLQTAITLVINDWFSSTSLVPNDQ